jgi:hypothetical protein
MSDRRLEQAESLVGTLEDLFRRHDGPLTGFEFVETTLGLEPETFQPVLSFFEQPECGHRGLVHGAELPRADPLLGALLKFGWQLD